VASGADLPAHRLRRAERDDDRALAGVELSIDPRVRPEVGGRELLAGSVAGSVIAPVSTWPLA
jgi:hypothetical protein